MEMKRRIDRTSGHPIAWAKNKCFIIIISALVVLCGIGIWEDESRIPYTFMDFSE
jgi:hypothetical protein